MQFSGKVIKGIQVGAKFGIATANLAIADTLNISEGVHFVAVQVNNQQYNGLMHYGHRQTFGGEFSVEVHILDFSSDIYGTNMTVQILGFLRETKKFKNGDELFTQIETDIIKARKYFLRETIETQWERLSSKEKQVLADKALHAIEHHPEFQKHDIIFVYAPHGNELQFVENLCKKYPDKVYAFPKIQGKEMSFYRGEFEALQSGKFQILEPTSANPIPPRSGLMIVPGVAGDKSGHRLGRGGGYYDRFLSTLGSGCYTLCILPKFAQYQSIPVKEHDKQVDEMIFV